MSAAPTFTTLLDWVEGRLTTQEAATVEAAVASGDPETTETIAWIREFLHDARSMPLREVPSDLSASLSETFERLHRPMRRDGWTDASLLSDLAAGLPSAGVRASEDDGVHLAFDSEIGRFVLDVTGSGSGEVDIRGLIMPATTGRGVDLAFLEQGELRRAVRAGGDGRFDASGVPAGVDELWLTSGSMSVRATIDLRG